jgi:hypothetical protein
MHWGFNWCDNRYRAKAVSSMISNAFSPPTRSPAYCHYVVSNGAPVQTLAPMK